MGPILIQPSRVVIEHVRPEVDGGHFPIKRTPGEPVRITADIHADGHDQLAADLLVRRAGDVAWTTQPMRSQPNDLWEAVFTPPSEGIYDYTVQAWVDRFLTWRSGTLKKLDARQEVVNDMIEGVAMIEMAAAQATNADQRVLQTQSRQLKEATAASEQRLLISDPTLTAAMRAAANRGFVDTYERVLRIHVERERARFGAWYEFFPRSAGTRSDQSATFSDAERRLADIAGMGFDIVYLPPIHPIGVSFRKGRNNGAPAATGDPGSPWAIGSEAGGHTAVHPELGTLKDFDHFVATARRLGLETALDLAFQCSPDHPYVREHPEWFRHRVDGSIKYAENPPKKYEDIYPLDFEGEAWESLWQELLNVTLFWADRGIRIFRVDNPHTKPYRFWEWLMGQVRAKYPETIFLAEAFTRPKVMAQLAKVGFSQSYTYFTWRNTKAELTEYLQELTQTEARDIMRPNFFTNTPDILHAFLQTGGRNACLIRFLLAATLGASYGIYGPAFETGDVAAVPGTEEYLNSEKYQIRVWDWRRPGSIQDWIKTVNRIRRQHPALQFLDESLRFYETNAEFLIAYAKTSPDGQETILTVINLHPHQMHHGWVRFRPRDVAGDRPYVVHDLLDGARYTWRGDSNYVRLEPGTRPAHIFRIEAAA